MSFQLLLNPVHCKFFSFVFVSFRRNDTLVSASKLTLTAGLKTGTQESKVLSMETKMSISWHFVTTFR